MTQTTKRAPSKKHTVTGHLDEIRPGVYRYRRYLAKTADGKQKQRSKTFHAVDGKDAARQARAIAVEWDSEDEQGALHKGTVGALVDEWVAWRRTQGDSPTTEYRRQSICNAIRADLGKIRLDALTPYDIDKWYAQLAGRVSPSTVQHYHRVLHAILRQGRRWRKIAWNPAEDASPPKKTAERSHDLPTPEALRAMLADASPSVRMACTLAASTGARRGELVGLLWSDLNGNQLTIARALVKVPGGKLTAKPPKTGRTRTITLDDDTLLALAAHRIESEDFASRAGVTCAADGPILAHRRSDPTGRTPYPPDWLSQEWERLRSRHGVTANLHSLRHFHATHLIDRGVAISTVSQRLGHSMTSTTVDLYTHALKQSDDAAAVVIADVLRGPFRR